MAARVSIHNADVADAFDEIGDLLDIEGENPFRIRAYRRAARIVRTLPRDLAEMRASSELEELPGIGKDLAGKIDELVSTGHLRALDRLRREVPSGVRDLLSLPGMGPVRVRALKDHLHVRDRRDLARALSAGWLAKLRGFGPVLRSRLATALAVEPEAHAPSRMLLSVATQYAEPLRRFLASLPGVTQAVVAGSYRRARDTVGDLDLLVSARAGAAPIEALERYADFREITAAGTTKAAAVLRNGLRVDIRVVPPESFGAALLYFTGNKDHNVRLRRLAQAHGWRLSEYGLFDGEERIAGETEEQVYRRLGLASIPPELREDRGELEAAQRGALPRLIERGDLRGDLHAHTDASDGLHSLERMAAAAQAEGLAYLAITDHAKHLGIVHGLDAGRLARQGDAIDRLNETLSGLTLLKGAEVDILEDGRLALADAVLARLDVVVIAAHGHFDLSQDRQTSRILRALERPHICVLAHPSGRLLGEREPCALDFDRVLDAVRARGCAIEVNGQPSRLDLDDVRIKAAVERGVTLSLASDAHSAEQLANLRGAVLQARRGWARSEDVLNCGSLEAVRRRLRGAAR